MCDAARDLLLTAISIAHSNIESERTEKTRWVGNYIYSCQIWSIIEGSTGEKAFSRACASNPNGWSKVSGKVLDICLIDANVINQELCVCSNSFSRTTGSNLHSYPLVVPNNRCFCLSIFLTLLWLLFSEAIKPAWPDPSPSEKKNITAGVPGWIILSVLSNFVFQNVSPSEPRWPLVVSYIDPTFGSP